ncbi:hypothetical protein [Paraburkholderia sp. J67]|uniref:hypothetical protein n=1 Tax=Paraburkholderia sp. J67 TaxID=2805435 RepID=UPI002ABD5CC3|nr:hypothetical protein [Paraburkholderia sp. J67]
MLTLQRDLRGKPLPEVLPSEKWQAFNRHLQRVDSGAGLTLCDGARTIRRDSILIRQVISMLPRRGDGRESSRMVPRQHQIALGG